MEKKEIKKVREELKSALGVITGAEDRLKGRKFKTAFIHLWDLRERLSHILRLSFSDHAHAREHVRTTLEPLFSCVTVVETTSGILKNPDGTKWLLGTWVKLSIFVPEKEEE